MPMVSAIKFGRISSVGAVRSVRFPGRYGKRGLYSSPQGYATLSSRVDDGFKNINGRFDKFDQRLEKIDLKVGGWVKWGVRFGVGLIIVGFGAMFESRDHMDKKMDNMRELISKSIKDSEERLESKMTLSLEKGIRKEVRDEVQYAMGLVNAGKNREAEK